MPDVANFVNPLSGYEAIEDVAGQVRKALRRDCSLRREDGYSGGYKGKIQISLDCFAVRTTHIEVEVPITQPKEALAVIAAAQPEDVEVDQIIETIPIAVEENLKLVRERIEENAAEPPEPTAATEEEPNLVTGRVKRRYTRRAALAGAVAGE